jgi:predicted amidohydrolase
MRPFERFATVLILAWSVCPLAGAEASLKSTSGGPPRKVIVGTLVQSFFVPYPGTQKRLEELETFIDRMADQSKKTYARGLDLVVLPEVAVTGDRGGSKTAALPFEGIVKDRFVRKAREHHCYIVVPMFLVEDEGTKRYFNVSILIGRNGEVMGTYRKLHLAVPTGSDSMEGGVTPGKDVPVFQTDFGKLGMQICFDMEFDYGWKELARQGAELVAWPTQSPQTSQPGFRARRGRYYIVSSTWRHNASIFEPTGKITAQVKPPQDILVQELDLSYALLPWSSQLRNGAALRAKYGDKVGFRYYEDEDVGIFWSNDPAIPIRRMIQSIGVTEEEEEMQRIQNLFRKAGVPDFEAH